MDGQLLTFKERIPTGRKTACALGDSITSLGSFVGPTGSVWFTKGFLQWVRAYLNDYIDLSAKNNFAASGGTVASVITEQLPKALAAKTDLAFVHIGTNDLLQGLPVKTITDNLKTIYDALLGNSTTIVAIPVRLRNGASYTDLANSKKLFAVNQWIADYARSHKGVIYADPNPGMVDTANGQALSQYLVDGLHDNVASAQVAGKLIADKLRPMLTPVDNRCYNQFDIYDAVNHPRGNVLLNGVFNFTDGAAINGASGAVAGSWTGNGTAGGASVAFSKEAYPGQPGQNRQVMTLGGNCNGNFAEISTFHGNAADIFTPGELVECEVEVEYNITTGGILGVVLDNFMFDAVYNILSEQVDGFSFSNAGLLSGSGSFVLRTDPTRVPVGIVNNNYAIRVILPASGAIAGTVKVARASMRKVF